MYLRRLRMPSRIHNKSMLSLRWETQPSAAFQVERPRLWRYVPHMGRTSILLMMLTVSNMCLAQGTLTLEPENESYNFVSHYRIEIAAPKSKVWEHLVDLGSWMYEFEISTVSGPKAEVGEILRLYPDQEFYIQITKAVPERVLVISNLPSTFNKEESTGVSVMTLNAYEGGTILDLTMSRRYVWTGDGQNAYRSRRQSEEFNANTDAMWERFLKRLSDLALGA